MMEIIYNGTTYLALLLGCYDGDTCTIRFSDSNPIVAEQRLRLSGFDTPEIRGKCDMEKQMAKDARDFTRNYLKSNSVAWVITTRDKYGRVVVEIDGLADSLVQMGLARYYDGKSKRLGWCDDQS